MIQPQEQRCPRAEAGLSSACVFMLAVFTALGAASVSARAEGLFPSETRIPLAGDGVKVHVDDFNADGLPDAAIALQFSGRVSVLFSDASLPGLASTSVHAVGLSPVALTSGDLDGNGASDIVTANYGSGTISVLLNRGDGGFQDGVQIPTSGTAPRALQVADVDGDGHLDVLVSNLETHNVSAMLGDGRGGFSATHMTEVGRNPHSIVAGDFDGDGHVDFGVTTYESLESTGRFQWEAGNGDGTFRDMPFTLAPDGGPFRYSFAGDFDGDGLLDVGVVELDGELFLLKNLGDWTFEARPVTCCGGAPGIPVDSRTWNGFLLAADVEGDGDLDLVTRIWRKRDAGFRVYENDGDGLFPSSRDVLLGGDVRSLGIADFDGDGYQDALASAEAPEALLYRGRSGGRLDVRETLATDQAPIGLELVSFPDGELRLLAYGASDARFLIEERPDPPELLPSLVPPGRAMQDLTSGNLDGRGGTDLAATDLVSGGVLMFFLDGDGVIEASGEIHVGSVPRKIAAGDLDGDGLDDIVVSHGSSLKISILLGPGSPSWEDTPETHHEIVLDSILSALALGDIDGDGNLDLLMGGGRGSQALLGDGLGQFPRTRSLGVESIPAAMDATDLDADGVDDVVVSSGGGIHIVFGASRREDLEVVDMPMPFTVSAAAAGDVNGDGAPDIVLAAESRPAAAVLAGDGGRVFGSPDLYGVGTSPRDIVLVDLDRDGKLDVVTADRGASTLSILRGRNPRGAAFRRGDTNSDGKVNLTDAIVILGALFLGQGELTCPDAADGDDNGMVNLTDAVFLLNHLFRGGDVPPDPGPEVCGPDPTGDDLASCQAGCL